MLHLLSGDVSKHQWLKMCGWSLDLPYTQIRPPPHPERSSRPFCLNHTPRPWDSELRTSCVYKKSFPPLRKQRQTLSYWSFHHRAERERRRGITVKESPLWKICGQTEGEKQEERKRKDLEKVKKKFWCCCFGMDQKYVCLLSASWFSACMGIDPVIKHWLTDWVIDWLIDLYLTDAFWHMQLFNLI